MSSICEQIVNHGTSADRQLVAFRKAMSQGATSQEALMQVVDQLIAETQQGWRDSGDE